jgi:hypothetical protein
MFMFPTSLTADHPHVVATVRVFRHEIEVFEVGMLNTLFETVSTVIDWFEANVATVLTIDQGPVNLYTSMATEEDLI